MNIEPLFKGRCVISIKFSDGSEIQTISTMSKEILESLDIVDCDGFVDLTCMRIIPPELLLREDTEITINPGTKLTLDPLDELFQNSIKNTWERVD